MASFRIREKATFLIGSDRFFEVEHTYSKEAYMTPILILFIAFVGLGLIFQKFDNRTRLFLFLVAIAMVIYVTIS
jgi:hypothetical protein